MQCVSQSMFQSPPFGVQFPAGSFANTYPILMWWLTIVLLGLLTYPLVFAALRGFADRGYTFGKTLSLLLVTYCAWILASVRLVAFSHLSLLLALGLLLVAGVVSFALQREAMLAFVRQHWRLLLLEELLFTSAFLLFAGIRSLDPDLWAVYLGGEKPMEVAFLNSILRSPYMPPFDPWFAGGYINYYYYGFVIIGALIKLTGIAPATAFNLAIPTLFALTFTGAFALVYGLTRRYSFALLGGYFAALIGNSDGAAQVIGLVRAALAHLSIPMFDYWSSSRIIPYTINEFPFLEFSLRRSASPRHQYAHCRLHARYRGCPADGAGSSPVPVRPGGLRFRYAGMRQPLGHAGLRAAAGSRFPAA